MYAGTTIRRGSGKLVGVHQKIDRAARRRINRHLPSGVEFPLIKEILHFEGNNGPDAIKHMKPVYDQPWHFINPNNPDDRILIEIINNHIMHLSKALAINDHVKAAFEAAWLAHAITDGLTPPHHYPLDEKIEELWGHPRTEMANIKEKGIIKGKNGLDTLSKNWQYWNINGVLTTHLTYEFGVAMAVASERFKAGILNERDFSELKDKGFETIFLESVNDVYNLGYFDEYCEKGWTRNLAVKTKDILIPEIIRVVALAWYQATVMSQKAKR